MQTYYYPSITYGYTKYYNEKKILEALQLAKKKRLEYFPKSENDITTKIYRGEYRTPAFGEERKTTFVNKALLGILYPDDSYKILAFDSNTESSLIIRIKHNLGKEFDDSVKKNPVMYSTITRFSPNHSEKKHLNISWGKSEIIQEEDGPWWTSSIAIDPSWKWEGKDYIFYVKGELNEEEFEFRSKKKYY